MGPGDIKQKIDERGAKSNLSPPTPALRALGEGLGTGGRVVAGSCCAREPRAHASSRVRAPDPRAGGGTATLVPARTPRGPPTLRRGSGGISVPFHAPGAAGRSGEPRTSLSPAPKAPGPGQGFRRAPPAFPALPTSRAPPNLPRIQRGAPRPHQAEPASGEEWRTPAAQPPPGASGKRGQVTTQGAPGASGRQRPLSSACGAAPPGHARRLLAPTPPRRVLKGAARPVGLCPRDWEGHARDFG